jgi:hypothetical protein
MTDTASRANTPVCLKPVLLVGFPAGACAAARAPGLLAFVAPHTLAPLIRGLRERMFIVPLFVCAYAVATALALPGSILTVADSAIFGVGPGSLLNWCGASAGAVLAFLLAPALGLDEVAHRRGWIARTSLVAACALWLSPSLLMAQRISADHSEFDRLLRQNVVNGRVDYDAFDRAPEFKHYLALLDATDPATLQGKERLAYWINTYNAYTIELINRHKERQSIRNINKSLGFLRLKGPWGERIVKAGGQTLTLDDVEHRIIRKDFREPRIHFALVCAALGCPPLRSEAYTGATLDAQLEDQGRLFLLESPTKNRVDVAARTVHVSMIFNYYREDFGSSNASVGSYIAHWYPEGPERRLLSSGDFTIKETPYDWSLNRLVR